MTKNDPITTYPHCPIKMIVSSSSTPARIRCGRCYQFSDAVEAFIKTYKLGRGTLDRINPFIHDLAGGFEAIYADQPKLSSSDLTPQHIESLLANQAGHLDITLRNYLYLCKNGSTNACWRSLIGLRGQLRLARYRFLNHPTHSQLIHAREIELEALEHCISKYELHATLQKTLALYND